MVALMKGYIQALDGPRTMVEFPVQPERTVVQAQQQAEARTPEGQRRPEARIRIGSGTDLTLELFFDTFESGRNGRKEYVEKLEKLSMVDDSTEGSDNTKRPPYVLFGWGKEVQFKSMIKSITTKYTMFHPDGVPARATVQIQLTEAPDEKGSQNPSSLGAGVVSSHTVMPGETLDLIAYRELGEASLWKHIAETNSIDDPWRLVPGERLVIAEPR